MNILLTKIWSVLSFNRPSPHPRQAETFVDEGSAAAPIRQGRAHDVILLQGHTYAALSMSIKAHPQTNPRHTGAELASCLASSPCVLTQQHKAADCLRPPLRDELPTHCLQLQKSYAHCRRGWLDMRKRFRGNRPITASQELEADASGKSYQLYSGAPAFSKVDPEDAKRAREMAREADEKGEDYGKGKGER